MCCRRGWEGKWQVFEARDIGSGDFGSGVRVTKNTYTRGGYMYISIIRNGAAATAVFIVISVLDTSLAP